VKAGKKIGLRSAHEVFSDRTYQEDGSLTSRRESNALITDHTAAVKQVIRMVKEGKVTSIQGTEVSIEANTICIHGDGESALEFAKYIPTALRDAGIKVAKISDFLK
jgi:UPF0271 protein